MNIAICDDEQEQLSHLTELLAQWQAERQTMLRFSCFQSAAALLDAARRESFTLYLLDVMMPGTSGLGAAREIRTWDETTEIVFLTTSTGFAYESYRVRAMDYLLKPTKADMLFPLLDRIALREQKPEEGLTLKSGSMLIRVLFSQLCYVEVTGKHLYFHMTDGAVHKIFGSLHEYETILLQRPEFMRPHRSYIVNMLQAAELSPAGIRTFTGDNLPISRLLYSQIQKAYMQLLFDRREV